MRINVNNKQQQRQFRVEVDDRQPPSMVKSPEGDREVYLEWEQAFDDRHHLKRCPVCQCRELFVRKDFPQVTGFAIVVLAAVIAMWLFIGAKQVIAGLTVLAAVAVIDAMIFLFAGRLLVCYRCRSEFRNTPIRKEQSGWELATGEKYREVPLAHVKQDTHSTTPSSSKSSIAPKE